MVLPRILVAGLAYAPAVVVPGGGQMIPCRDRLPVEEPFCHHRRLAVEQVPLAVLASPGVERHQHPAVALLPGGPYLK